MTSYVTTALNEMKEEAIRPSEKRLFFADGRSTMALRWKHV